MNTLETILFQHDVEVSEEWLDDLAAGDVDASLIDALAEHFGEDMQHADTCVELADLLFVELL